MRRLRAEEPGPEPPPEAGAEPSGGSRRLHVTLVWCHCRGAEQQRQRSGEEPGVSSSCWNLDAFA